MTIAWQLTRDVDHLELFDLRYDLELVEIPGALETQGFSRTKPVTVPEPIPYEGCFAALDEIAFPVARPQWPVMSRGMYDVLAGVAPLPAHRWIAARIQDDEVAPADRSDATARDDFGILHLLEHLDLFDYDRSVYERRPHDPARVHKVRALALKTPDAPLPPIFRLAALPDPLFVSDAARNALIAAGIRCRYVDPAMFQS